MDHISLALLYTAILCSVIAAIYDLRALRLPNEYAIAIIGLALASWGMMALDGDIALLIDHIRTQLIIFSITFISATALYITGIWGAGDAKHITAMSLWLTPALIGPYLFAVAGCGFMLGVFAITLKKRWREKPPVFPSKIRALIAPQGGWFMTLVEGKSAIPYGIALSYGFFIVLICSV
jgi:Flp pilus assembly protein protease CpaA